MFLHVNLAVRFPTITMAQEIIVSPHKSKVVKCDKLNNKMADKFFFLKIET